MSKQWTKQELETLKENYPNYNNKQILEMLPYRSLNSICDKAGKLGIKSGFWWSNKEDKFIINNYGKIKTREIAKVLNRTINSIKLRASLKNLKYWNNNINFHPSLNQILLGSMLGDGTLSKTKRFITASFIETHSLKQKEYLLWKYQYFKEFAIISENKKLKIITLFTRRLPFLNEYHRLFYPQGKGNKIITEEALNKLSPLSLAIWYLDDGTYHKKGNTLSLAMSVSGVYNAQKYFKEKYNFNSYIVRGPKNSAYLHFNVETSKKFISIIKDYVPNCMQYKIIRTEEERLYWNKRSKEYKQKRREMRKKENAKES